MGHFSYSQFSFHSMSRQLKPFGPLSRFDLLLRANRVNEKINSFTDEIKDYRNPIIQNLENFRIGIYGELGRNSQSEVLAHDFRTFLNEQKEYSHYAKYNGCFWAIFYDTPELSSRELDLRIRDELGIFKNFPMVQHFDNDFSEAANFCEVDKKIISILALHPGSLDSTTHFYYPSLLFKIVSSEELT
jgi:hypothetical protein